MKHIMILLITLFALSELFSQSMNMYVKKDDGSITTIPVTNNVEICFSQYPPCTSTFSVSYENKNYRTVQIGTQCWLKENLNVGTMINGSTNQSKNGTIEKYCYNNDEANCTTYGGLYQWAEAVQYQNGATNSSLPNPEFIGNVQGICPTGWHIPTKTEFQTLAAVVSNNSNALKSVGQGSGAGAGTNTSGFSALLAGYVSGSFNDFGNLGSEANFWPSSYLSFNGEYADWFNLDGSNTTINLGDNLKLAGYSVRCLKD